VARRLTGAFLAGALLTAFGFGEAARRRVFADFLGRSTERRFVFAFARGFADLPLARACRLAMSASFRTLTVLR
jgi:hypothetical protein